MKGETVSYEDAANRCCSLPGDLMVTILQRLPVKSLLRFKSVSKNWLFLIVSPQFIAKHLNHHQRKRKLVIKDGPTKHHQSGILLISRRDHNDRNGKPFSSSILSLDYHHIRNRKDVSIVGSSNGLVCFKFCFNLFFGIWNPATREIKFLPVSPRPDLAYDHEYCHTSLGFSYVPSDDCYKLVRISAFKEAKQGNNNNPGYVTRVQVFDMGKDCWREVLCHGQELSSHELPFYLYHPTVVVNGCMHWFESTFGVKESRSMVWFDMEKEVFVKKTEASYPFDDCFSRTSCELTVFEGNLAMIVSRMHIDCFIPVIDKEGKSLGTYHQLWIYEKANNTWKKEFTFGPLPINHYPSGFWGDEEIIMEAPTNDRVTIHLYSEIEDEQFKPGINVYLYNRYSKEKINNVPCGDYCDLNLYPYVESLVQI